MDGAKPFRVVWHIVLPLLKPGLIGASLLIFLLAWHNFALGLILSSTKAPVTVALLKLLNPGVQFYPVMAAGLVVTMFNRDTLRSAIPTSSISAMPSNVALTTGTLTKADQAQNPAAAPAKTTLIQLESFITNNLNQSKRQ